MKLSSALSLLPESVRMKLHRLRHPASDVADGLSFMLAGTKADRDHAHSLLKKASEKRDAKEEFRLNKWSFLPCSAVLLCKKGEEILGAVSLVYDDGFGLPSEHHQDLSRFRRRGQRLVEITGIAFKRDDVFLPLFRFAFEYAHRVLRADGLIIMDINREPIYADVLKFKSLVDGKLVRPEQVPEEENYPKVLLFEGLEAHYQTLYGNLHEDSNYHHYFFAKKFSEFQLPKRKFQLSAFPLLSPEQFRHFLVGKSVIERLSHKERMCLADTYAFSGLREEILAGRRPGYHRASPRIPVRYKASVVNADSSLIKYGEVQQIAIGGLSLNVADLDFSVGEEISVVVDLDNRSRVKVKGHVVWTNGQSAGVKLEEPPRPWHEINEYAWAALGMKAEVRAA
jgi:hypothetical protein